MFVLVIEDNPDWHVLYPSFLKKYGTVMLLTTLEAAQAVFDEAESINLIVMDGCLESKDYDTGPLTRHIRSAGYTGPIIGGTSQIELGPQMEADGCDFVGLKIDVRMLIDAYEDIHGPIVVA